MFKINYKLKDNGSGTKSLTIPKTWLRAKGNPTTIVVTLGNKIILEAP